MLLEKKLTRRSKRKCKCYNNENRIHYRIHPAQCLFLHYSEVLISVFHDFKTK